MAECDWETIRKSERAVARAPRVDWLIGHIIRAAYSYSCRASERELFPLTWLQRLYLSLQLCSSAQRVPVTMSYFYLSYARKLWSTCAMQDCAPKRRQIDSLKLGVPRAAACGPSFFPVITDTRKRPNEEYRLSGGVGQ
jgi:hypothetical protein